MRLSWRPMQIDHVAACVEFVASWPDERRCYGSALDGPYSRKLLLSEGNRAAQ